VGGGGDITISLGKGHGYMLVTVVICLVVFLSIPTALEGQFLEIAAQANIILLSLDVCFKEFTILKQ
jgi:hypothetical protein